MLPIPIKTLTKDAGFVVMVIIQKEKSINSVEIGKINKKAGERSAFAVLIKKAILEINMLNNKNNVLENDTASAYVAVVSRYLLMSLFVITDNSIITRNSVPPNNAVKIAEEMKHFIHDDLKKIYEYKKFTTRKRIRFIKKLSAIIKARAGGM